MKQSHFRYKDWSNGEGNEIVPSREHIEDELVAMDESTLLMDGFDEAFIGFTRRINEPILAVYDWQKMVDVLIQRDGLEYEEAVEYIDYNCLGAWVGEQTPLIVMPLTTYDDTEQVAFHHRQA